MSSSLGAMGSLPGKLRSLLLSSKNKIPDPLKDEIKLLAQDLEEACTFLVDLSSKVETPHTMVKIWRNEVLEMSYDLEDYIDKTAHPYSNQFDVEEFCILVELARDACKSYHRYHIGRLWPTNPSFMVCGQAPVPALNGEARYIVGIDDARHKLISLVRENAENEQRLKVVAIHGPAGVGKTTLAQEVYREIGGEFDCRAFVQTSRMADTRRLLRSIISQIQCHQRPYDNYTVQKLIDSLREYLQQKRYFIVIDGLWEITSWNIVRSAFSGANYCSRILITTDIEEVAQQCSDYQSDEIILMKPLSSDYSAKLLNYRLSCYKPELFEQLKENLEDIIRTCSGLPLAIISAANILASQPDKSQLWCQVKGCLSSRLQNNLNSEGVLREIVSLNYDCLSHDLKLCLQYLSMYPEGYTFLKNDLLKQWTAEGFIDSAAQENANEVAESYFDELVCRGLIQLNHINFSDTVVTYTVHSTMFEIIRYKSIEDNFTTVIDYSNTIPEFSAKVRRLSLRYSNAKYATKPEGITLSPVRSLMFYGIIECLPSVMEFQVLRVLNLEFWGGQEKLDLSGISQLFQLRYVRITTDIIVKLPTEVAGLKYLETLEIYARVTSVPSDIVHLPSLLHLCLHGEINMSDGIGHMRSLRTLQSFDLSINSEDNVRSLSEMTNLHDLHVTCSTTPSDLLKRNLISLASSLGKHGKLISLILAPGSSCTSIYMDCSSYISTPPASLQRLELLPPVCIFARLPEWIVQLQRLRIMKIFVRELTRDDMSNLAGLQNLTVLSLYVEQPIAESIIFNHLAFPFLKYFKFRCGVLRLDFQEYAIPNLQALNLEFNAHSRQHYGDMLAGIENLLNIKEIIIRILAAPGAEESDRIAAESILKKSIKSHPRRPSFSIIWAESVEEEVLPPIVYMTPQFPYRPASSSPSDGQLNRPTPAHVISQPNQTDVVQDMYLKATIDPLLLTNQTEEEVKRLTKQKGSRMKELVLKKRLELENICRNAHIEPDMNTAPEKIIALIDSGLVDPGELLSSIEVQIAKANEESLTRKDIMERVDKWLSACDDETWLEEYDQDDNRYRARRRGSLLNLKRAEKARILVQKIPSMIDILLAKTSAWEDERNVPFLYDGVRLVAILEEQKFRRARREEDTLLENTPSAPVGKAHQHSSTLRQKTSKETPINQGREKEIQ